MLELSAFGPVTARVRAELLAGALFASVGFAAPGYVAATVLSARTLVDIAFAAAVKVLVALARLGLGLLPPVFKPGD